MKIKKLLIITICLMTISQTLVYSMTRYAPRVSVPVSNSGQPLNQSALAMPEATLNPELLNQVQQDFESQQAQQSPWTTQKMWPLAPELKKMPQGSMPKSIPAQKRRFWSSGVGPFKNTSPKLMSRSEAFKALNLDQSASPADIKKAYKKAALKAHPDTGGSSEKMQKVNEARDLLTGDQDSLFQDVDINENEQNAKTQSFALYEAIKANDLQKIKKLIRSGINVNIFFDEYHNSDDTYKNTPLCLAIDNNNINIVKLLLSLGADPNFCDSKKTTALERAVKKHNLDIIKMLLDAGANPNANGNGYRLFSYINILNDDDLACFKVLVNAGITPVSINRLVDDNFFKSIKSTKYQRDYIIKRMVMCIKLLMTAGKDIDERLSWSIDGDTPLHVVEFSDPIETEAFLAAGANVNIKNNKNETPLDKALQGKSDTLEKLDKAIFILEKEKSDPLKDMRFYHPEQLENNIEYLNSLKQKYEKVIEILRSFGGLTSAELGQ